MIKTPLSPAPLSSRNAYTSWPGGVDPSTPLFNANNQKGGKKNKSRKNKTKKNRKARSSRK